MISFKQSAPLMLVSLAAGAIALGPGRAVAQDRSAVDKLVQMNKKALEDYDTLEWDAAKKTLLDALMSGKKAGLDNHPVMARTYIHLGAVYLTGFKDKQKAMSSFQRALEIDPAIQLSKGISTPDVQSVFAEAQRRKGAGPSAGGGEEEAAAPAAPTKRRRGPIMEDEGAKPTAAAPPPRPTAKTKRKALGSDESEPALPAHVAALDCPAAEETLIDKPVTVRCAVAPNLPVDKVFVLYQMPGEEDYVEAEMTKSSKGWLQAKIPKKAVSGTSLKFYFEGRNAQGKPVVANGGKDSPNIMLIIEEESADENAAAGASAGSEDENPLEAPGAYNPRMRLGRVNKEKIGLDTRYGTRKYWIGLGIGSGYGYAKGKGLEARDDLQDVFQPGLAWAGVAHLVPEFGYQITPDSAISIAGRLQYIPQPAEFKDFAARGALSVLLKYTMYTKQKELRFFASGIAGGGEGFRFIVYPDTDPPQTEPNRKNFKDTVKGGPGIAGVGGGLYYEMSHAVSLVLEVNVLAGFPAFSVVTDLNLGLQFNLYSEPKKKSDTEKSKY
jgi:hypothetical protein